MTIIVTGGAGFIGSNFIFHMLNKYPDYRIICLDCLTYAGNLSTLEPVMDNPNFRFDKESITDRDAVYKLFEEEHPDMVVNFAAESHVDRSIENPEVFLDTNIKGTAVLIRNAGHGPDLPYPEYIYGSRYADRRICAGRLAYERNPQFGAEHEPDAENEQPRP